MLAWTSTPAICPFGVSKRSALEAKVGPTRAILPWSGLRGSSAASAAAATASLGIVTKVALGPT